MQELIDNIRRMSALEKVLGGVALGGILMSEIIPNQYVLADGVCGVISSLSCLAYGFKLNFHPSEGWFDDEYSD